MKSNEVLNDTETGGGLLAADLRSGSVESAEVSDNSLTGTDIDESSLGAVPTASNAFELSGIPGYQYQRGCQPGAVRAYARVLGAVAGFPTTDTSSSTYVDNTFWCSAGPLKVRRQSLGRYTVTFPPAGVITHVLVNVHSASGGGTGEDDFATVKRNVLPTRMEAEVIARDADGARENATFSIVAF